MAELIDKNGAIKLIEKEFDMNCLTEWGQGYIDAMKDVKGIIALLPTTTEAEIRAKAIKDFLDKLLEHETENWVDHQEYGITWADLELVAEQLKERD